MDIHDEKLRLMSRELMAAEHDRVPIEPLSQRYPSLSWKQAYAIQLHTVESKVRKGARVLGAKVGYTSVATQRQFGVSEPVFGLLLDPGVNVDGGDVPYDRMISPRIEPEIACVLKDDLRGPGATVADALGALAGVMPAFELVDSRFKHWRANAIDMIADCVGGWGIVLAGCITPATEVDLRHVGMVLERNGTVVSTGAGAAALGNPADVLVWLANRLAGFGLGLSRGQVVITGSLVRAEPVARGDCYRAQFDHLGSVSATFH